MEGRPKKGGVASNGRKTFVGPTFVPDTPVVLAMRPKHVAVLAESVRKRTGPFRQDPRVVKKLRELRESKTIATGEVPHKSKTVVMRRKSKTAVMDDNGRIPATMTVEVPDVVVVLSMEMVSTVVVVLSMETETIHVLTYNAIIEYKSVTLSESDNARMTRAFRDLDFALDCRNRRFRAEELVALRQALIAALHQCVDSRPHDMHAKWMCGFCELHICLHDLSATSKRGDNMTRDQCRLVVHQLRLLGSHLVAHQTRARSFAMRPGLVGPEKLCSLFLSHHFDALCGLWSFFARDCHSFARAFDLDDMIEWVEDMLFVGGEFAHLYANQSQCARFWHNAVDYVNDLKKRYHQKRRRAIDGSPHFSPPRAPVAQLDKW